MVKKARKWVKETVLGVAGTILTATVLGMLGFSSGSPGTSNTPVINTSTKPLQNQLQNQLAGALQQFATKASQTATAVAQEHLKKQSRELGFASVQRTETGYRAPDQVRETSFSSAGQAETSSARFGGGQASDPVDPYAGRYSNVADTNSGSGRYGTTTDSSYAQPQDSGSSTGGFKSNTAETVAANVPTTEQSGSAPARNASGGTIAANPSSGTDNRIQTVADTQPAGPTESQMPPGIEGHWEQLVYNPDDKMWYSGGIYRVTKEQQSYRLAFLDTSQIKPVYVSIAGIKNLRHAEGIWSFESHLDSGEVLEFKLQKKDETTFQGYCYQDGVQLSINAWRKVDPKDLK